MYRRLTLGLTLLSICSNVDAQGQGCELDVPLNVVMPDAALVRNLPQDAFTARRGNDLLPIRSVETDTAPRRIVIVAEDGNKVNPAARRVEAKVLETILRKGRDIDSFAFLTAVGPRTELPFGTSRESLFSAVGELAVPQKGKAQTKSMLETVMEAAIWLQPAQPGDAIFLVTMGIMPDDPSYGRVMKTLTTAGIRLFGLQLGGVYVGIYSVGVITGTNGTLLPNARVDPNRQTMFDLADETGGFFLGENTEGSPQQSYKLTDERLQRLEKLGGQLYKGVAEYYRIRLPAPPAGFAIELSNSLREQLPKAHMTYPRKMPACAATSPNTSRN